MKVQWKYKGVLSNKSLLLAIKSTGELEGSYIKQLFIISYKVNNDIKTEFCQTRHLF